jgi:hypothetical protein
VNLGGRYFWIDATKNGDPLERYLSRRLFKTVSSSSKNESCDGYVVFPDKGVIKEYEHIINADAATVPELNPDLLQPISFKWHDGRRTQKHCC